MEDDALGDDAVARLGAEIHAFMQAYPEHFATRALVDVVAREAAGEPVPDDERMLALTSVVQALRDRRRRR
jgi:hypothetical protein